MADELFTKNDPLAAGTAPAGEPEQVTDTPETLPTFLSREEEVAPETGTDREEEIPAAAKAADDTDISDYPDLAEIEEIADLSELNALKELKADTDAEDAEETSEEPAAETGDSEEPDSSSDTSDLGDAEVPVDAESSAAPVAEEQTSAEETAPLKPETENSGSEDSEDAEEMLPYGDDADARYNRRRAKRRLRRQRLFGRMWVTVFLILVFGGIGWYMLQNYNANPLGYFTNAKKLDYYYGDDYTRAIKADYILDHKDEYDAVILGGSKSGVLDPQLLKKYTGLNYYNMYFNQGNFSDYLAYTQFLISATDIKEITLHLSSYETYYYDASFRGNAYHLPAAVKGNAWDRFTEFLSFLMTDYETLKDTKNNRDSQSIDDADKLADGMRNRWPQTREFYENPDKYVAKYVLTDTLDTKIKTMFAGSVTAKEQENRDKNIAALRQIKQLCDENGVTLKVIVGAGFLGERFYYECDEYYEYLSSIVYIVGEVWDFSQFNDYNLNPYNFINYNHYSMAMGEKIINTVYGGVDTTDFGQRLTKYNIHDYLQTRKAAYQALLREYRNTGTIQLGTMDDDSWVVWPTSPEEMAAETLEIEPVTETTTE